MPYSIKIAARYLTANLAQTMLLILGVAVGVYVFVFMSALIGGLAVLLTDRTVGNIAHVTIEAPDRDPVSLLPPDQGNLTVALKANQQRRALHSAAAFTEIIAALPHVEVVAGQILGNGFLAKAEATAPVSVTGVEPGEVSAISRIGDNLVGGSDELGFGSILIGEGLAESLGVGVGQTVMLTSDRDVRQTFTVSGIFALGVGALDNGAAFVTIRSARVLFAQPEGLTRLQVKLDDLELAEPVARTIVAATGLKATPWTEGSQDLLDALVAQGRTGDLIKIFALITIVIGVASALLLSTYRRESEIGIMRAMGATRRFVVVVFVLQGALIGASGGLMGALLGYLSLLPFPLPEAASNGGLPIDVRQGDYLRAILLTVAGAIGAAIWPASSAARVDPVKAIGA